MSITTFIIIVFVFLILILFGGMLFQIKRGKKDTLFIEFFVSAVILFYIFILIAGAFYLAEIFYNDYHAIDNKLTFNNCLTAVITLFSLVGSVALAIFGKMLNLLIDKEKKKKQSKKHLYLP